MNHTSVILLTILFYFLNTTCKPSSNGQSAAPHHESEITCTDKSCEGTYQGAEFVNGADVAHQFSNTMSDSVGEKLKELYRKGKYSKVDFVNLKMSTEGMGSGSVVYKLFIPFTAVEKKCQAYTSFDHVGGWNHAPALSARKVELSRLLLPGEALDISHLKITPEGLQEHWIQWKNKEVQADCKK